MVKNIQIKKEEKGWSQKKEEVNFTAPKIDNICVGERGREREKTKVVEREREKVKKKQNSGRCPTN